MGSECEWCIPKWQVCGCSRYMSGSLRGPHPIEATQLMIGMHGGADKMGIDFLWRRL